MSRRRPKDPAALFELMTRTEAEGILDTLEYGSFRERNSMRQRLAGLVFKIAEAGPVENEIRAELETMYSEQRAPLHLVEEGEAAGG